MFNLCSSVKVKENNKKKKIKYKKNHRKYIKSSYKVKICNDMELHNLNYMGTVSINFNTIKHLFGEPQKIECYREPFAYEYVWYIKFNDGSIASISKHFKIVDYPRHNLTWRVCANYRKGFEHIIMNII